MTDEKKNVLEKPQKKQLYHTVTQEQWSLNLILKPWNDEKISWDNNFNCNPDGYKKSE